MSQFLETYTTRVDTIFGVTAVVIAPEHPLTLELTTAEHKGRVVQYIEDSRKKTDLERTDLNKHKSGVFTGSYVKHPLTGEKVPVWIADYVLPNYGTGAVMMVPAHDERDFEFAQKYNLDFKAVIHDKSSDSLNNQLTEAFTDDGVLFDSGNFSGLTSEQAREQITNTLENQDSGWFQEQFKLRDWLVSRQRYWGSPIPVIYTPKEHIDQYNQNLVLSNKIDLDLNISHAAQLNPDSVFMERLEETARTAQKHIIVDCLVMNENGEIFIQKRSPDRRLYPNMWDFPGGHLDAEESVYSSFIREVKEETNWDVSKVVAFTRSQEWEVPLESRKTGDNPNKILYQFLVEVSNLNDLTLEDGKVTEGRWVSAKELELLEKDSDFSEYILDSLKVGFKLIEELKIPVNISQKPQVVIVHGGFSYSEAEYNEMIQEQPQEVEAINSYQDKLDHEDFAWYRNVENSFKELDFEVFYPQMPNSKNAKYQEWKQEFSQTIAPKLTTESHLIGHSLGGLFLVKYLAEENLQIKSLHLVSPAWSEGDFEPTEDWDKLNQACESIYIWHSEDDVVVPYNEAVKYHKFLHNSIFLKFNDRGHFTQTDFPEIVDFIHDSETNSWTSFEGQKYRVILDKNLPIVLPTDVDFRPDGQSPLRYSETFSKVICPLTGLNQEYGVFREKDTMDTFVCSSWYYLRYLDNNNRNQFASKERIENWMPVDIYVGGAEHAVLHLLYARFFYKALKDGELI